MYDNGLEPNITDNSKETNNSIFVNSNDSDDEIMFINDINTNFTLGDDDNLNIIDEEEDELFIIDEDDDDSDETEEIEDFLTIEDEEEPEEEEQPKRTFSHTTYRKKTGETAAPTKKPRRTPTRRAKQKPDENETEEYVDDTNNLDEIPLMESFANESMEIKADVENTKMELIALETLSEIITGPDAFDEGSRWTLHDMSRRRRATITPGAGNTLPAVFYGYPRDLELRPPSLIMPNNPAYEVSATKPPSEQRWAECSANWVRSKSNEFKSRNDKFAQEIRKNLRIDGRDTDMLFFLWRFRNTPPIILAYLLDVAVTQIIIRLRQLKRAGLVLESTTMGGPLFSIASFGAKGLGLPTPPLKEPNQQAFNHDITVYMLAAMAERGEINPLYEGGPSPRHRMTYPKWNGEKPCNPGTWGGPMAEGDSVEGPRVGYRCISEIEIRSAWHKWGTANGYEQQKDRYDMAKREMKEWDGEGLSPELRNGNEHLLMVQGIDCTEHNPDLVIKRPRVNGKPNSICVEVELKLKRDKDAYYKKKFIDILSCDKYSEVHYFTPSVGVAACLKRAADSVMSGGLGGKIFIHQITPTFGGQEFFWRKVV